MSFLGEFKRRKVFQVAAVYAVVAWLLIQISDTIADPLSLPSWFPTFVIVTLGIGFPIALILSWIFDISASGLIVTKSGTSQGVRSDAVGSGFMYIVQALVLVAVLFLIADQYVLRDVQTERSALPGIAYRGPFVPPEWRVAGQAGDTGIPRVHAVSPDGSRLATASYTEVSVRQFSALDDSSPPLLIRMSDIVIRAVFSPDSSRIAIATGLDGAPKIYVVDLESGLPRQISTPVNSELRRGIAWLNDDWLLLPSTDGLRQLNVITEEESLLLAAETSTDFFEPFPLPDGEHILVAVPPPGSSFVERRIQVWSLDSQEIVRELVVGTGPRYVPSGHLLFVRDGILFGQAFNLDLLEPYGDILALETGIGSAGEFRLPYFDVSANGIMAYISTNEDAGIDPSIYTAWFEDHEEVERLPIQIINNPNLSEDGAAIAYRDDTSGGVIILYHFASDLPRPFTSERANYPVFERGGDDIFFTDSDGIFAKSANNTGSVRTVIQDVEDLGATRSNRSVAPYVVTQDWIVFRDIAEGNDEQDDDLGMLSRRNPEEAIRWLAVGSGDQRNATLAADEKILAYEDCPDESRTLCVIAVQSFPDADGRENPAVRRGMMPLFVGNRLFFVFNTAGTGFGTLMSMNVSSSPNGFEFSEPAIELDTPIDIRRTGRTYAVTSDGSRIIATVANPDYAPAPPQLIIDTHWHLKLEQNVSAARGQN